SMADHLTARFLIEKELAQLSILTARYQILIGDESGARRMLTTCLKLFIPLLENRESIVQNLRERRISQLRILASRRNSIIEENIDRIENYLHEENAREAVAALKAFDQKLRLTQEPDVKAISRRIGEALTALEMYRESTSKSRGQFLHLVFRALKSAQA